MLSSIIRSKPYQTICTILFGLLLIGLPFTSVPLLTNIFGSMTGPLSAIPLVILMLIWLLPYLLRRGSLPSEILPLLYFSLIALIISGGAFFLDGFYSRGRDFFDQSLRAFITLGIGLSFYITLTAYMSQRRSIIRKALIFLYIGGTLNIIWSLFEIYLFQTRGSVQYFPQWVLDLKSALVFQIPGIQYSYRLTGFAYEPSWFVLFFDLTLFPLWLSAVFQRKSLFNFRLWIFQIEDFLLPLGVIAFAFGYPRIALIALFVGLIYLGLIGINKLYQKIYRWLCNQKRIGFHDTLIFKVLLALLLILFFASIIIGVTAAFVQIASQGDYRYQLLIDQLQSGDLLDFELTETNIILLARRLAFYERTLFWYGGWRIFGDYPFGVGVGNAGFYFVDRLNSLGYGSYEVRNLLYQANNIINVKSLWVRLLAETGIIGFITYLTWVYLLWRSSGFIRKSRDPLMKIVGLGGQIFILAYIVEGFSVDSFAIPYQWIIASLISASALVLRKERIADRLSAAKEYT